MASSISCSSCGKTYTLKPEYAGKKLKCKCGATIAVPAEEEETYDFADSEPASAPAKAVSSPAKAQAATAGAKAPARAAPAAFGPAPGSTSARGAVPPRRNVVAGTRSSTRGSDSDEKSMLGKIGAGIVTVLVILGIGFKVLRIVLHANRSPSATSSAAPTSNADDDIASALMAKDMMVPMSQWLTTGLDGKMLGGYSKKQAEFMYRQRWQKQLGVTEVFVSQKPMSLVVVFELPTAPAARAAIYGWQAKWHADQFKPIVRDTGGQYLIINIPLVKPD